VELEKSDKGLGISIAGGVSDPVDEGDNGIYITEIILGGAAEQSGKLRVDDKVGWVYRAEKRGAGVLIIASPCSRCLAHVLPCTSSVFAPLVF
jgi:hypothetical protein